MSDYKSINDYHLLTHDQLMRENERQRDLIAKLEVNNSDLTNKIVKLENEKTDLAKRHIELEDSLIELRKYHKEFEQFAATVYDPKKSTYKELETKVAQAEELRKKDIDELWETRITPLQNKVKDQHIQLESQYKRETKLQQEIKNLKDTIHDAETVINFAVGYISTTPPHTDKHPMEIKKWLYNGIFKD